MKTNSDALRKQSKVQSKKCNPSRAIQGFFRVTLCGKRLCLSLIILFCYLTSLCYVAASFLSRLLYFQVTSLLFLLLHPAAPSVLAQFETVKTSAPCRHIQTEWCTAEERPAASQVWNGTTIKKVYRSFNHLTLKLRDIMILKLQNEKEKDVFRFVTSTGQ